MIDWGKPIETVPCRRNPEPVPCRLSAIYPSAHVYVVIEGDWEDGYYAMNRGRGQYWGYDKDGTSNEWLPQLRNVPGGSTMADSDGDDGA